MHCSDSAASTICANCEGVVREEPFYRAYIKSSTRKQCLSMCEAKIYLSILMDSFKAEKAFKDIVVHFFSFLTM